MTPESQALLDALVPPLGSDTTDHTDAIYALTEPLHDILDAMDSHLIAIDRLRRAADRVESDPKVWGWFERFKQNVDGGKRLTAEAKRAIESLSDLCFQMDGYALQMRETIERKANTAPQGERVILRKEEHDHLKATIDEQNARLAEALAELNTLKDKGR